VALGFIMKEPSNRQCFDCGSQVPSYASLNNGVVVCDNCAQLHKSFGNQISFLKSLVNDTWTDEEIMYLQVSGNKGFAALMKEYSIPTNLSVDYKYSVMAADYYRKSLFCELNNKDRPVKPDIKTGQKLITKYNEEITQPPKKGFFGKIDSFFSEAKTSVTNKAKELDSKYDISGKGEMALIFAKNTGDKIVEKGKEFAENPTVKEYTKKTEEGFNKMVQVTKKTLGVGQDNTNNQVQQSQNVEYNPQHGNYENTTNNQPLLQNNQQNTNQEFNNNNTGNIQTNYPTFNQQQPKQG